MISCGLVFVYLAFLLNVNLPSFCLHSERRSKVLTAVTSNNSRAKGSAQYRATHLRKLALHRAYLALESIALCLIHHARRLTNGRLDKRLVRPKTVSHQIYRIWYRIRELVRGKAWVEEYINEGYTSCAAAASSSSGLAAGIRAMPELAVRSKAARI